MMILVFTKSNNIISKLICAVTKEPVSHVAILPFSECILHATFTGVDFTTLARFTSNRQIVYALPIKQQYVALSPEIHELGKASYDFKALLWCGLMLLLRRWFPRIIPKRNLWQTSGMFMCTELVTDLLGEVDSMITPYQLYKKLEGATE